MKYFAVLRAYYRFNNLYLLLSLVLILAGNLLLSEGCGFSLGGDLWQSPQSYCGNGQKELGEACDREDLGGQTCSSLGYVSGILSCTNNCHDFDRSHCEAPENCGDGIIDAPLELCDGSNLAEQSCLDLGYGEGNLACLENCADFDPSACEPPLSCGNGALDGLIEVCDGNDFSGLSCADFGFDTGFLICAADCLSVDASQCNNWPGDAGNEDGSRIDAGREDRNGGDVHRLDASSEDLGLIDHCAGLTETGRCDGDMLKYCQNGEIVVVNCSSGTNIEHVHCGESATGLLSCVGDVGALCIDVLDCMAGLSCQNYACVQINEDLDAGYFDCACED